MKYTHHLEGVLTVKFVAICLAVFLLGSCSDDEDPLIIGNICSQVFEGDVTLASQMEVDAFSELDYCKIQGFLSIQGGSDTDPIVSLAPLENLQEINGLIVSSAELTNLQGLHNLESIDILININNSFRLQSILSLQKASGSVDALQVFDNRSLKSLNGIQNIRLKENAFLNISKNDSLVDISALTTQMPSKLRYFGMTSRLSASCSPSGNCTGSVFIHQPFTEIPEFEGLEEIEDVLFRGYEGSTFSSFKKLKKIQSLHIQSSMNLTDLTGFRGLVESMEYFQLFDNPILTSLDGLDNLPLISDTLSIFENDMMMNYCAISLAMQTQMPQNYYIMDNAYNPSFDDIIMGNCSN